MATYTIPACSLDKVNKQLARLKKKANKYGTRLNVSFGDPYIREIRIYNQETDRYCTEKIEAVDVTIDSEDIRCGNYAVAAGIEHLENGNIVWSYGDIRKEWTELHGQCQHCGRKHGIRFSFIVRNPDGEEKQVGRTCLKDYCGIDPQAVGIRNELEDLLLKEDVEHWDGEDIAEARAIPIDTALALAWDLIKQQGYRKSSEVNGNKYTLLRWTSEHEKPSQEGMEQATGIIAFLRKQTEEEAFSAGLSNIRTFALSGYCKPEHLGYVAYAPLAWERYQERCRKVAEQKQEDAASKCVGVVGERLTLHVRNVKLLTSWENDFGGRVYLQRMQTEDGNVLIWKGSSLLDESCTIRATIREHTERDGIKQTIITRVKAVK